MKSLELGNLLGQIRSEQELYEKARADLKIKSNEELIELCRFHKLHIGFNCVSKTIYWCAYDELCCRFNHNNNLVKKMIAYEV